MGMVVPWLMLVLTARADPSEKQSVYKDDVTVAVFPSSDGKSRAFVETDDFRPPPGDVQEEPTVPYGHLWIVSGNDTTTGVQWASNSRGVAFDLNPLTSSPGSLVPRNLQWDSTEPYLYFEFGGGAAASGVWRVHATNTVPRYVGPTREAFKLSPKANGPDWVVCSQVRDGQWRWYAYTPEDIARDVHTFSTNEVPGPTVTVP
jgi:hypothetical protein